MKTAKFIYTSLLIIFISINTLAQITVFSDDFELGTSNWTLTGTWGLSTAEFYAGSNSITESPTGNYLNNQAISATLSSGIDLSSYLGAEISFWAKYDIEAAFDYMYIELSKDGGSTYQTIDEFTDVSALWNQYTYNIGSFAGYTDVRIRFRFYSDQYVNGDGMYIDNVVVTGQSSDNSAPLIVHIGPANYEGTLGDYLVNADISDVSGIASSTLYYNVDGNGPFSITGTHVSGDQYSFIIPSQPAGSNVYYKIKAVDNSISVNETDTSSAPSYTYISGSYLSYDNGAVDAVSTITGTSLAAVKVSIPSGKYGFLKSVLIRNYRDVNHSNSDMLFHVWDNNSGLPGNDIIVPFLVTPEATLENPFPFTRIDLRSYSPELDDLAGDIFVGFSVPQNSVNLVVSNTSSGRSYSYDGTVWNLYSKDYEFRAVIDESSSPLPVELTTFNAEVGENSVSLLWETATEVNNYGFEVERQKVIKTASDLSNEWENLGFVEGHGNSNSPKYYLFEDNSSKISGTYRYRLKQMDIDGKFEYSDIVEVNIVPPNKYVLEQNYPNPFNPTTVIKYSIPEVGTGNALQVQLKVYDILGKEIVTLVNENKSPGLYNVKFDASEYPSGLYFYTITAGNFSKSRKMILMK